MNSFISEIFLPVIRAAFDLNYERITISDDDYEKLLQIGKKQSILPIIWSGLKKLGCSEEKINSFEKARLKDTRDFVLRNHFYNTICESLNSKKISYVPLKGSVLRDLYPEPWMRTSCDIDILVHEYDIDAAITAIEDSTDFRKVKRGFHDISFNNKSVHFELHFSIIENMPDIDRVLLNAWDYTENTGDGYKYIFFPEYQIFHVLAHMSYHLRCGGLGIRPFIDLWLLRTRTEYDEKILSQLLEKAGILTFYEKCCAMLGVWLYGDEYTPELSALEEYCLAGGVYGSKEIASAAALRDGKGLKYFKRRLFISRTALEGANPKLKKYPFLLPFFQVKRWFNLKDERKRKRIAKELNGTLTISQQKVDSFDNLLKSLGL